MRSLCDNLDPKKIIFDLRLRIMTALEMSTMELKLYYNKMLLIDRPKTPACLGFKFFNMVLENSTIIFSSCVKDTYI